MTPGTAAANPPMRPAMIMYQPIIQKRGSRVATPMRSKTKPAMNRPMGNDTSMGWMGWLLMAATERMLIPREKARYISGIARAGLRDGYRHYKAQPQRTRR